jgi:predicted sulfurtransferase
MVDMPSIKRYLAIGCAALAAVMFSSGAITHSASKEFWGPTNSDEAARIKPEEARELLKKNKAVLVDVRNEASYKAGHIKGALNIPFNEIRERARELPRDKMIITYCS